MVGRGFAFRDGGRPLLSLGTEAVEQGAGFGLRLGVQFLAQQRRRRSRYASVTAA